ncbi:MAG TPA: type I glutamate--ammonia ligase [Candidatus Nitrosotalea sp.]|nr:type I glutamate--ammonia ligase [Candidatus Nitrosotalea sp.]
MTVQNYKAIIQKIKKEKIDYIELWFVDIFGELHSLGMPSSAVTEHDLQNGFDKLDSSSIRGFGSIDESDVLLVPDVETFRILPKDYDAVNRKNARMFVNIYRRDSSSSDTGSRYDKDSRGVCLKASEEIVKFGLSKALWGPEIEFFVFDKSTISPIMNAIPPWKTKDTFESDLSKSNDSVVVRKFKAGYYQAQPIDTLSELRKDICDDLGRYFGIKVEAQHHEVATDGQCEINIEYGNTMKIADDVVTIKNLTKVKAARLDKVATFMPKPIYGDNASAMHMHQSLWTKDDHNAMYDPDDKKTGLSQLARYYIGGILDHAGSLCAISNPTTNSYKRLVPGYEAPVYACWGVGNRSTAIRVPRSEKNNVNKKRIEFRVPDSAANIYLLESAILMAGLDGIKKKIDPGDPVQENVYHLTPSQRRSLKIRTLPGTLKEALDFLQNDNKFLKGIFAKSLLDTYLSIKYKEYEEFAQMPTSWEVFTYSRI